MDFTFTNCEDSETQVPDDMINLEIAYQSPPTLARECKSSKWKVQVIDSNGNIEGKMVSAGDVWKLQSCKVIIHFDEDSGQPVNDSGGLFGSWLGQLSNDVNLLPIDYDDWRNVTDYIKDKAWDVIEAKFSFDDPATRRAYVMSALGSRCKDVKLRLWKQYKRNDQNETMQNRPINIPEGQWHNFVHRRFTDKWKKMQERNTKNQKKNIFPHVCGRKSFGRNRREIKIKTGKIPSRAEFFVATRTRSNGAFVSDLAQTRAAELTTLVTQNPSRQLTNNVIASFDDEYAQVFGPERPGRIRCVGRGPTPSKLFRSCTANKPRVQDSEVFIQMESKVKGMEDKLQAMTKFLQRILGGSSEEQAAYLATAVASIPNPVAFQEAGDATGEN